MISLNKNMKAELNNIGYIGNFVKPYVSRLQFSLISKLNN